MTGKEALKVQDMFGKEEPKETQGSTKEGEIVTLPKDAVGISDEMLEGMYGYAYRLYTTGKYTEAVKLFRLMVMLNPIQEKFMMGLAASFHMLKDYQNAATTYTLCSVLDPEDPFPYYHISDCLMELNLPKRAMEALEKCVALTNDNQKFVTIHARAQIALDNLKLHFEKASAKTKKE